MSQESNEHITIPPDGGAMTTQPVWRRDFPIDWPQDHYVSRRDFTKFMILTSLAFTVGQFWIAVENFRRRRRGEPAIQQVAMLDQLAVGSSLTFAYPEAGDSCVLVRAGEQSLMAFSQKCTHLSCAVVPRVNEGRFFCPCHEGSFDLQTGAPVAGPPRRPLPRIKLEVRNGVVYATGVEIKTV
jgi:nitrite reductase/ring-hydroxylating ferredoxin subunit